jgi:adenosylhomocysteine nucleosidase
MAGIARVAVLAPMPSELAPVVRALRLEAGDDRRHRGRVGAVEVVATRTGMGLALAAEATERLLDVESVDHVVVVGIAGGIGTTAVGDLIRPEHVEDRGSGARYRATPLGPAVGLVSSSDEFLVDPDGVDALVRRGVLALDMETAAIAAVCEARQVPWSAVRVISDLASDHSDAAVLDLVRPDGTPDVGASVRFLVRNPRRIPGLVRLGRDSMRAARAAAAEVRRQLEALDPA